MPIHDWTRVDAGIFHDFHLEWMSTIKRHLNRTLDPDYYALAEQVTGPFGPDVLALKYQDTNGSGHKPTGKAGPRRNKGGLAVAERPLPKATFHIPDAPQWYASKGRVVTIRHVSGDRVVAVIEIVSSGNKNNDTAFKAFVNKAREFLYAGINLVLIDVYPPTTRDPEGIHPEVWGGDDTNTFRFDPARPLTFASYIGGPGAQAFVEPGAVGESVPTVSVFLNPTEYVPLPLEATYMSAFEAEPTRYRKILTAKPERKRK
jgi:hypothetical protein